MGRAAEIPGRVDETFGDILQTASELVRIPSRNPPGEEKRCAEYIYSRLKEFGLETHLVQEPFAERPQVVALRRGKDGNGGRGGGETVILNGHIDTVPEGDPELWSKDPFSGSVKEGLLHGRGSVDMKSALAIMMHISRIAEPRGNLLLTFAVGEERAEAGTSMLLSYVRKKWRDNNDDLDIRYGLVLEPTSLSVATCQKGAVWFRIRLKGRAAHASMPKKGINAIEMAGTVMSALNDYAAEISKRKGTKQVSADGDDGSPTCTVTMINGGLKENVIPDRCELVIDRRLLPGESGRAVEQEVRMLLDGLALDHDVENIGSREPVEIAGGSRTATTMIDAASEATGGRIGTICFPGATDNQHLVANGIESVVWGPGNLKMAHAIDECISLDDIKKAAIALGLFLNRLP